uniref:hypothetical protein n=1 Tax=Crenothrix polyspora TaxID=360316 RepID=UPI0011774813
MHTDTEKNIKSNGVLSVFDSDSIGIDTGLSKKIQLALIDNRPLMLASFINFINHATTDYSINPFSNFEELLNPIENEITTFKIIVLNIGYKRIGDRFIN